MRSYLRYMHSAISICMWRSMTEMANKPTLPELIARIREREPYTGPSVADRVREDRDSR